MCYGLHAYFMFAPKAQILAHMQDDSCTWSPEQLQMAVGFSPEDSAPEQEALTRAESAGSPGTALIMPSTPLLTHSYISPVTHCRDLVACSIPFDLLFQPLQGVQE